MFVDVETGNRSRHPTGMVVGQPKKREGAGQ